MFRVFTPFFLNDYQYLILFFLTVKSSVLSPLNVLADFRTSLADILLRSCFTGFFVFRSIARRGSLCLAVRTVSTLRRGSVWLGPQRVSKPGLSLDHFSTTVFNLCALKVTPFISLLCRIGNEPNVIYYFIISTYLSSIFYLTPAWAT